MAQLSARENFFLKKHNKREAIDIQYFPLVLYVHLTTKISNLLISPMGSNELIAGDFSAQKYILLQKICAYHKKTLSLQGKNADNRKNTP